MTQTGASVFPDDRESLQRDLERVGTVVGLAREYGVPRGTLAHRLRKHGVSSPTRRGAHAPDTSSGYAPQTRQSEPVGDVAGVTITGDTASIVVDSASPLQPDALLAEHGLDAAEWVVTHARPNSWQALAPEGEVVTLHQLKVEARRRIPADALLPARVEGWSPKLPRAQRPKKQTKTELVLVVSDTHAPYHDANLHDCLLQWLEMHQPARAYDFGDLLDLPIPSRHRPTKGFEATPQESIDVRYRLDAERVAASPTTKWTVALGNHDERIDHAIRDKIGAHIARLARAGDTLPVMDLGFLLRYDELGITLVRPYGDYHSVTIEIAPGLFGRHGTKAGKHGGAAKAIERRASSYGQGHDHKQIMQQFVRYDDAGVAQTHWLLSWGAMCQRDLGYVEDPDVAQGFTTITLHDDGSWHPEFARFDSASQSLLWRGERYTPRC